MTIEDQYNAHYSLVRDDGVRFRWTFVSHWSDVVSEDDPTVTDHIKWFGGIGDDEEYIGHSSGFKYKKIRKA